jgi:hypothetical protein
MNARKPVVLLLNVIGTLLVLMFVLEFAHTTSGLRIIDVSDPANPASLGSLDTQGGAAGVAISGTVAFVTDGNSDL